MTADLLLCCYSLGWVACGVAFAVDDELRPKDVPVCLIMSAFLLIIFVIMVLYEALPRLDPSKQYLWRRKP